MKQFAYAFAKGSIIYIMTCIRFFDLYVKCMIVLSDQFGWNRQIKIKNIPKYPRRTKEMFLLVWKMITSMLIDMIVFVVKTSILEKYQVIHHDVFTNKLKVYYY